MNFISREAVLALIAAGRVDEIAELPSWPVPNPTEAYDRNILGQTESEFWAGVEGSSPAPKEPVA